MTLQTLIQSGKETLDPELLGNIAAGSGDGSDEVLGRIGNFDQICSGFENGLNTNTK